TLLIHQKLTGHLLLGKWEIENGEVKVKKDLPARRRKKLEEKDNQYIHILWWFDNGLMMGFSNLRKFGEVELWDTKEINKLKKLKKLGPEPLTNEFTFTNFKKRLKGRSKNIKKCLLDQEIVSGIGNIYSDEILWDAKINPFRSVKDLKEEELKKIFNSIKKIIKKAIKLKGESISDYRIPDGTKGNYDDYRKVYRKEGEKCPRGDGIIKRKKTGGRSAHYCPNCQK
ncbi:MAG: DNA-formamidopyrimidine glycosylase, partial [Minisyncoccales bacterium]